MSGSRFGQANNNNNEHEKERIRKRSFPDDNWGRKKKRSRKTVENEFFVELIFGRSNDCVVLMTSLSRESNVIIVSFDLFEEVGWEAVLEALHLFTTQFDLVLELALLDDKGRLRLDEVLVVGELLMIKLSGEHLGHSLLFLVNFAFQLFCLLMLLHQNTTLLHQLRPFRSVVGVEGGQTVLDPLEPATE